MTTTAPIRVLVVDDSAVARAMISRLLSAHPDINVVGTALGAKIAREKIQRLEPDCLTLDVDMPEINGIEFLEEIMADRPMPVVMCSALTTAGGETAIKSLDLGAFDVIGKPKLGPGVGLQDFATELADKVRAAGRAKWRFTNRSGNGKSAPDNGKPAPPKPPAPRPQRAPIAPLTMLLPAKRNLIVIGASTGGPEALRQVLCRLPAEAPPVAVVQHMPEEFTTAFSESLNKVCVSEVIEAQGGEDLIPGRVLIAPGHRHLQISRTPNGYRANLSDMPPVNRHRPSVEVLFNSIAPHRDITRDTVAIMLTGMGKDGAEAMLKLKQTGTLTICQDEESSVVWGMPGEAVKIGAADRVASIERIAQIALEFVCRES